MEGNLSDGLVMISSLFYIFLEYLSIMSVFVSPGSITNHDVCVSSLLIQSVNFLSLSDFLLSIPPFLNFASAD